MRSLVLNSSEMRSKSLNQTLDALKQAKHTISLESMASNHSLRSSRITIEHNVTISRLNGRVSLKKLEGNVRSVVQMADLSAPSLNDFCAVYEDNEIHESDGQKQTIQEHLSHRPANMKDLNANLSPFT